LKHLFREVQCEGRGSWYLQIDTCKWEFTWN